MTGVGAGSEAERSGARLITEREHLEKLLELTTALSSAATAEGIASITTRLGAEALGTTSSGLWACDDTGDLRLLAAYGMADEALASLRHLARDADVPVAAVARTQLPVWSESDGILPLVRDGKTLGVVCFGVDNPRGFSSEGCAFLVAVAVRCADALARARLYEDARRAERRLTSVLDKLPVGVTVVRASDGAMIFGNDALTRIWGVDMRGLTVDERSRALRKYHPDGRPVVSAEWPSMRALDGEITERMEMRVERRDGTTCWVHGSAAPIRSEDGTVEAAVASIVDVTAEKQARAAADEASLAKDEFLAMLGHELRNPLAPILTALHLMRLRGEGTYARERAVIARQVNHLARLVDDLLDVSRATRGALRLECAMVEVAPVVADAVETAGPLIEERRHRLRVTVPRTGLVVNADAVRLAQVVGNLLSNAAKYTPPGGHIRVSAVADGDHVVIEVSDDGAGIPQELLPRVFDAFTQGRQGLDRKQGGLGLGLAIARQLIVGHGGTIEARSAGAGRGTTMVVRLPRVGQPSATDRSTDDLAREGRSSSARRVLVVDDNPDAAELLEDALACAGHEVRTAPDGPSALQLVKRFSPDIAFLDIGLPVMDGYELAGMLRRLPALRGVPLVAVTGYAQDNDRQRALDSGFTEHLAKPLDPDRVLECIERLRPVEDREERARKVAAAKPRRPRKEVG
jgi:PAS domain S-box-containing protein